MKRRGVPDPKWKSGPTYPEPTSDTHFISEESQGYVWDGFGQDEAEQVEGEPVVVVHERYSCSRDNCDEAETRRLLFTTWTLTDSEMSHIESHVDVPLSEFVYEFGERVDEETIEVEVSGRTIGISVEETITHEAVGKCYGDPHRGI